jgi:threonine synthase
MWQYAERLPVPAGADIVTLGEGGTPLVASRLATGFTFLWKDESRNPTGSHKDRALSIAATHARACGARVMVVVSAGSTGLSNAAYAAQAGLAAVTLVGGEAPAARLMPVHALGSLIINVDAPIDDVIAAVRDFNGHDGIYDASTTRLSNPMQAEAPKTIAWEIVDDLGSAPDWVIVPTGGGGTLGGLYRGFRELLDGGAIDRLPRLVAVVPRGYDALRRALAEGVEDQAGFDALPHDDQVETVLTKLSHAHPPDGLEALAAIRATGGQVLVCDDARAIAAVRTIGAADGLYLEPSSTVAYIAMQKLWQESAIRPGETVVAIACGSGFRETFTLQASMRLQKTVCSLADIPTAIRTAFTR